MSKLREKMIRAMELKNLSKHSQKAYLAAVTGLAKHYHKSPQKDHQAHDRGLSAVSKKRQRQCPQQLRLCFDRTALFLQ